MKKIIAIIITLMLCASLVVACGKKNEEESVSETAVTTSAKAAETETTTAETKAAVKDNEKKTSKKEDATQKETTSAVPAETTTASGNSKTDDNVSWGAPQNNNNTENTSYGSSNTSGTENVSKPSASAPSNTSSPSTPASTGYDWSGSYESMWDVSQPETSGSTYMEEPETTMPHVHIYELTEHHYEGNSYNNYDTYTCYCGDSYTVDLGWVPCLHVNGGYWEVTGRVVCNACHITLETRDDFVQHTLDMWLEELDYLAADPDWRNEYGTVHAGGFTWEQAEYCNHCGEILSYSPAWGIR